MIPTTVQCIVYHISTKRSDRIFNTIVSVIWKNNVIILYQLPKPDIGKISSYDLVFYE